eukprot:12883695-Ditylum_brightwellii.AAC.1
MKAGAGAFTSQAHVSPTESSTVYCVLVYWQSTKIMVTSIKGKIKKANVSEFGQDIKHFNTCFLDKQRDIIKEVEEAGYTKYMHYLLKTYLTSADKQFKTLITKQRM